VRVANATQVKARMLMTSVRRFMLSELLYACRRHDGCPFADDGDFGTSRFKSSWRRMYNKHGCKGKAQEHAFYRDMELRLTSRFLEGLAGSWGLVEAWDGDWLLPSRAAAQTKKGCPGRLSPTGASTPRLIEAFYCTVPSTMNWRDFVDR
jgi:hypothetical protein